MPVLCQFDLRTVYMRSMSDALSLQCGLRTVEDACPYNTRKNTDLRTVEDAGPYGLRYIAQKFDSAQDDALFVFLWFKEDGSPRTSTPMT